MSTPGKDPADAVKAIVEHKADHDAVYRRKVLDLILSKIAAPAENGPYGSAEGAQYAGVQENLLKFDVMKKRVKVDDAFDDRFVLARYGK